MRLFQDSCYISLKHFYQKVVCKHMCHCTFEISYNHFVEMGHHVGIPLALFINKLLLASIQTSAALTVCH